MLSDGGTTVAGTTPIENAIVFCCAGDAESDTVTLKLEVPLAVGVPDSTPALVSVSPAGRLPDVTVHV